MTEEHFHGVACAPVPAAVPPRRRRGGRALVAAAVLALVLAGCGGTHVQPTPSTDRNDALVVVTPTPGTPIPRTPTPPVAREHYVVKAGDTLSSIAEQFGVSQDLLQRANNITDPNSIYVGQDLKIP